jgi:hypothetical protein
LPRVSNGTTPWKKNLHSLSDAGQNLVP